MNNGILGMPDTLNCAHLNFAMVAILPRYATGQTVTLMKLAHRATAQDKFTFDVHPVLEACRNDIQVHPLLI